MNKYTNIRREYNMKVNYYKVKEDWNIEKEFILKVKRTKTSKKNLELVLIELEKKKHK